MPKKDSLLTVDSCEIRLTELDLIYRLPRFSLYPRDVAVIAGLSKTRPDILVRMFARALPVDQSVLVRHNRTRNGRTDLRLVPVRFKGRQIYQDPNYVHKVGSIFSDPDLDIIGRTVREDIYAAIVAQGRESSDIMALNWLRNYGLSEKLDRETHVLSGGERQRLNCATALFDGTKEFILADFTSAVLDEDFRELMYNTIEKCCKHGGIALLTGIDKDDWKQLNVNRQFALNSVETTVTLKETKLSDHAFPGRLRAEKILRSLLSHRSIESQVVLRAQKIHRRGITSPFTIHVKRGELVIVTGPNGAGKTTFGEIICGQIDKDEIGGDFEVPNNVLPVLAPQSASESILGENLRSELPDEALCRSCGLVPETDFLLDPRTFSPGLKKLISIANTLRLSSGLAILDEPTSGMDFEQKKKFVQLLNTFNDRAIIIISHDPTIEGLGRVVRMEPQL